jgi:hypothetical protein
MPTPLGFRDLKVYRLAYQLAMEIFHESKSFPSEEKYSLTDQVRRSRRFEHRGGLSQEALCQDVCQ